MTDADKIEWVNCHKITLRTLLQIYGTEYRRGQDPEYWLDRWSDTTLDLLNSGFDVVVDDARFDNEIDLIIRMGGVHVYIETDPVLIQQRLAARDGKATLGIVGHASEETARFRDSKNVYVVNNSGSEAHFDNELDKLYDLLVDDAA